MNHRGLIKSSNMNHRGLIKSETSTDRRRLPVVATRPVSTMAGSGSRWALWSLVMAVTVLWSSSTTQLILQVGAVVAQSPEKCGPSGCTLHNAYGLWNDRSSCKAAKVVYPTTEAEIVAAVADAVQANQKMKVSTAYGHSIPKVACPGTDAGVIISSKMLTNFVSVDTAANTVTVQSGITMRALGDGIASYNLSLPMSSGCDGVTLGGAIANSVHGSSLWGKGGAIHEYVLGVRLVTPASAAEGYAKVRNITLGDPDLHAARVHLGVLGVLSTVTLQVEPQFKRNVTLKLEKGVENFTAAEVLEIARDFQYGEVTWYPALSEVLYTMDSRAPVTTPGDGRNNFFGMQPQLRFTIETARVGEELAELTRNRQSKCVAARAAAEGQQAIAYGYERQSSPQGIPNPNIFPVIGFQNYMMNAGGCQRDTKPLHYCAWARASTEPSSSKSAPHSHSATSPPSSTTSSSCSRARVRSPSAAWTSTRASCSGSCPERKPTWQPSRRTPS